MQRDSNLTRQIHDLIQGSAEWIAFRAEHHGASEAAAMLGLSTKTKRSELIRMKATGLGKEFSDYVQQNILDYGHQVEAMARPLVEAIIGDDLYPVTCSLGAESASCDGLTMSEAIAFEHKQWAAALAASVAAGELPEEHAPQCQQVLMVTGAEKLIFVVSDGTEENMVYMWVYPDTTWFDRIIAGWEQFDADVVAYVPAEVAEKPIAKVIMALPALVVQTRGEVVQSNLPQFQAAATAFIATIKTDLATDEDFVNADADVKFCQKAEDDLEHAKSAVMGQAVTIDQVMKTIDNIKEQLRAKRLALGKLIDSKKLQIKEAILSAVKLAYTAHVAALEVEIKPLRLPAAMPDFAGAMKNKRTLASLKDAVDTLLANAKISTNATAADYRAKQAWCKEHAAGHGALFMDMASIIVKPMDDFQLVINTRIAEHKRAEEVKAEAERSRIREEERVKAAAAAAETIRLAQVEADRVEAERVKAAAQLVQAERGRVAAETTRQLNEKAQAAADARAAEKPAAAPVELPLPAAGDVVDADFLEVAGAAPAQSQGAAFIRPLPSLRLGQINERIAPLSISVEGLRTLGFESAARDKAAHLYHERDFASICAALIRHLGSIQAKQAA